MITKERLTELYEGHHRWIGSIAAKFVKRYGGNFEEVHASANLYFVEACNKWNPERSALITWSGIYIWQKLITENRKNAWMQFGICYQSDASSFPSKKEGNDLPDLDSPILDAVKHLPFDVEIRMLRATPKEWAKKAAWLLRDY